MHVYECTYRPEVDVGNHPHWLSSFTLLTEAGSLNQSTGIASLNAQLALGILSLPSEAGLAPGIYVAA